MATNKKKAAVGLSSLLAFTLTSCVNSPVPSSSSSSSSSSDAPSSSETPLPEDTRDLSPIEYARVNLTGKDSLGRKIERYDSYKEKKSYVGLFYHVWHGAHETGIYDITKLESTEEGRIALSSRSDPASPEGAFHWVTEPLYGYYSSADPYVIRRHIELFVNAGVDYLALDYTNAVVYPETTEPLLDALLELSFQGVPVPKIVFYTNSNSGSTVNSIYELFYASGKYENIWFSLDGLRPLIIGITENNGNASDQTKYAQGYYGHEYRDYVSNAMQQYFDVRESAWPNGDYNANSIPWMTWQYPQLIPEETRSIVIPAAQHAHDVVYASSKRNECSRGYDNLTHEKSASWWEGQSFQQMWDYALEHQDSIDNFFVTGWNEWMAIKQWAAVDGTHSVQFVDDYNQEYSRDLEMTKSGELKDNFYLQFVANVKKLKMNPFVRYKKPKATIELDKFEQWALIPGYADMEGDAIKRDFQDCVIDSGGKRYFDDSARNDIVLIKVCEDAENLYFYIKTKEDITSYEKGDATFMNVLIHTSDELPSFEDYNFILNRTLENGKGSIEKSLGGFSFEKVGESEVYIQGNVMTMKVPRSALGLEANSDMYFKVADHVTHPDDIMDYYVSGDVAPLGRLGYGY